MEELKFSIGDLPVGFFKEAHYPNIPGQFRYESYRGLGHLQMQELLKSGAVARCHYSTGDERVSFSVTSCPQYGVIEIANLDRTAK